MRRNFITVSGTLWEYAAYILFLRYSPLLEYVAEALGTRTHATHVRIDLANYGMCMLVFVKMGNKQHPPPFWFTIKRKAVFVWVSRYEGTPPALAVASFVQVNYIGLRTGMSQASNCVC